MKINKFRWCNYEWEDCMEGGRKIHSNAPYTWYSSDENVLSRRRNGELHFYYRENPKEVTYWDGNIYKPSIERALIRTTTPFDYGTFSIEAMMPTGLNVSCAFWLSGDGNWPPEIDILEAWAESNNYSHQLSNCFPWLCPSWRTTWNVHYNNNKMKHDHFGSKNIFKHDQPLNPTTNWIKYECEWLPNKITFKANGKTTKTIGKKHSQMLVNNLKDSKKGYLMDVIIEINVENPKLMPNRLDTPLKVRNFMYEPMD